MKKYMAGCLAIILISVLNSTTLMGTVETPVTNGLFLALDASDVTESGSNVSSWNNQVTGIAVSEDFIQNIVTSQPTLVSSAINGLPALQFDGNGDYLIDTADSTWDWDYDTDTNNAARWTTFIVKQQATTNAQMMLLRSGYDDIEEGTGVTSLNHVWSTFLNNGSYDVHSRGSANAYVNAIKADILTTNVQVCSGLYNVGTTDPSIVAFIDGENVASTDNDITRQMSGHRFTRIGANTYSPYFYFNGLIAEVLVYKRALSYTEISKVNDYLTVKYGVSKLALHCTMDDADVSRTGTYPPPALTTVGGDWTAEDVSDKNTDGTATSTDSAGYVISSESGRIRQAVSFSDSTAGHRRVQFYGTSLSPVAGYGSLTVSLWMKPSSIIGTRMIATHGNKGSNDEGWLIYQGEDILTLRCNTGGTTDPYKASVAFSGITTSEWYNVVLVLDRNDNKIHGYLNGSTNGVYIPNDDWSDTFTSDSIESGAQELLIGSRGDNYEWAGLIDDFAIWKRALSADEIYGIYENGLHGLSFTEKIQRGTVIVVK